MNGIFKIKKNKDILVNYAKDLVKDFKDDPDVVNSEFYKECLRISKK